ncbi:LysR family transcriptional regulator [Novosphingobium sp.]|uniref:LysR family transcriptional regulator n=1 Tax=Novosphingobium sp. TaxID=1874826 RepID=UPI0027343559|nr:LysR family transcriptional regulator [Novosphingobium sp.]MDP3908552.1 LysR family transcriptional regulator [Novosphingobium sp.]
MQQLIALAQERNFTRAADALGMTQPALSRAIALLEAEAGVLLFERFSRGVAPTAAGEELIEDSRRILGSVKLVEHNVRLRRQGDIGKVSFALGPLAASCMLRQILAQTLRTTPGLLVTAIVRETSAIIDGVLAGTFDFGICSANTFEADSSLDVTPLAKLPMGLFVRCGHPLLAHGQSASWTDLQHYPRMTGRYPQAAGLSLGRPFGLLETTVECNDFEVLRAVSIATDSVWLTARSLVADDAASGALVEVFPLPFHQLPTAEIVLVRQTGRLLSPSAERIIDTAMSISTEVPV